MPPSPCSFDEIVVALLLQTLQKGSEPAYDKFKNTINNFTIYLIDFLKHSPIKNSYINI